MSQSRLYRDTSDPLLDQSLQSLKYFIHNYVWNETQETMKHMVYHMEHLFKVAFLATRVFSLVDQEVEYFVNLKRTCGLETACQCTSDQYRPDFEFDGSQRAHVLSKLKLSDEDFLKLREQFDEQLEIAFNCDPNIILSRQKVRSDMTNIYHDYCVLIARANERLHDVVEKLSKIGHLQFIPVSSKESILKSLCKLSTCQNLKIGKKQQETGEPVFGSSPEITSSTTKSIISNQSVLVPQLSIHQEPVYTSIADDMVECTLCEIDLTQFDSITLDDTPDCNNNLGDQASQPDLLNCCDLNLKETSPSSESELVSDLDLSSGLILSHDKRASSASPPTNLNSGPLCDCCGRFPNELEHSPLKEYPSYLQSTASRGKDPSLLLERNPSSQSESEMDVEHWATDEKHNDHNYYLKRDLPSSSC